MTIDGKPAATMLLKDIRALFMQPPGTTRALAIGSKDGAQRNVTLTLRDYV